MAIKTNRERRYQLVAQMREYDRMVYQWMPHVMITNNQNFRSAVCNTDSHGFRHTLAEGSILSYEDFQTSSASRGILSGGSTAFGIGSTDDKYSIPSLLNTMSSTTWFNFGVRAANSTQELFLFQLYLPNVDKVVILSGLNNLMAHLYSRYFISPFGGFIGEGIFYNFPNNGVTAKELISRIIPKGMHSSIRNWLRPVLQSHSISARTAKIDLEARYGQSLRIFERDMELWRMLADARKFSLDFVMQPVFPWTQKPSSVEEQQIFEILDSLANDHWKVTWEQIANIHDRYSNDISEICYGKGIDYHDLNDDFSKNGWQFVDRAHLTDEGNKVVAKSLERMIG